VQKILADMK